jgi:hypothetical protein
MPPCQAGTKNRDHLPELETYWQRGKSSWKALRTYLINATILWIKSLEEPTELYIAELFRDLAS